MILPISKGFAVFTVMMAIVVSLCDLKHLFILKYSPFLSEWNQYYRVLLLQLNFNNESEILISLVIFLRIFNDMERILGSYRFITILAMSFLYNIVLIFLNISIPYQTVGLNLRVSSGPIGIIFTILSFYNDMIPTTYQFAFNFGNYKFTFNDKVFVLIIATLLLTNQGYSSVIPSLNGWIIGKLILNDFLPAKNFQLNLVKRYVRNYKLKRRQIQIRQEPEDDEEDTTFNNEGADPVRPLGVQFLDTFRTA